MSSEYLLQKASDVARFLGQESLELGLHLYVFDSGRLLIRERTSYDGDANKRALEGVTQSLTVEYLGDIVLASFPNFKHLEREKEWEKLIDDFYVAAYKKRGMLEEKLNKSI